MMKSEFPLPISKDHELETQKKREELAQNPQIIQLIQRGDIDPSCIQRFPWKLDEWLKGIKPCMGCKGLDTCKQKQKGYFPRITFDGILNHSQCACRYLMDLQKKEAHLSYYTVSDLPRDLRTISFQSIDLRDVEVGYIQILKSLMEYSDSNQSVYLNGPMGTGKTFLAACACNSHAMNHERVAFIHYPTACARMTSLVKGGEYQVELNRLMNAKFLVIDDIGAESVTEWNRDSILLPLLNKRYENHLQTWFTSNCEYEDLLQHFSVSSRNKEDELKARRILERIEAMCIKKTLTGEDRRKIS